jgi:hypothetical protein
MTASDTEYVLTLSVSDFRAMRKAITVLMRTGMSRYSAIQILLNAHRDRHILRLDDATPFNTPEARGHLKK